jgi:hypothetical protein
MFPFPGFSYQGTSALESQLRVFDANDKRFEVQVDLLLIEEKQVCLFAVRPLRPLLRGARVYSRAS